LGLGKGEGEGEEGGGFMNIYAQTHHLGEENKKKLTLFAPK